MHRESCTCLVSCSRITCWQIVSQLCFFFLRKLPAFRPARFYIIQHIAYARTVTRNVCFYLIMQISCTHVSLLIWNRFGFVVFCSINMETIPREHHGNGKSVYVSIQRLFSDWCRVSKEGVYRWLMGKGKIFPQIFKDTMCFKFFFTFSRDMYILVYSLLLRCNSSSPVSAGIMLILNNEELTIQVQCQRWLSVQAAGRAAGRTSTTSCSHQTTDIVKTD